jgi:hypothetical protein
MSETQDFHNARSFNRLTRDHARIARRRDGTRIAGRQVLFSARHAWQDWLSEREMMDIFGYLRMLSPCSPIS